MSSGVIERKINRIERNRNFRCRGGDFFIKADVHRRLALGRQPFQRGKPGR